MGKYSVDLSNEAKENLKLWHKSDNKVAIKRIEQIFEELAEHPRTGIGKPERLKHHLSGLWSREIDKKNRIVYDIRDVEIAVFIVSKDGSGVASRRGIITFDGYSSYRRTVPRCRTNPTTQ